MDLIYSFFSSKDESRLSESCLKSECLAFKDPKQVPNKIPENGNVGHRAANFCVAQDAKYIIGNRGSGDEDRLCFIKKDPTSLDGITIAPGKK